MASSRLIGIVFAKQKDIHFIIYIYIYIEREREREGNGNPLQYSCLENPRDGEEPDGLPPMGSHRVGHD